MLINNRDIVLQGSGTINGGSGTPLSVPLPSGGSFMPKIDLKYMLERVDNLVYPYSSTNKPVSYILMVHTHVQNYVSGTNEYEYFDSMDKIFYFMIHNDTYGVFNGYKVINTKVKVYEPNDTEIKVKEDNHNAEFYPDLGGNTYTFNMLSTLLNSDNGDHKSDAPLNYLNFFPNEVNKVKAVLGSAADNMIVDTAFVKSNPKDSFDELPSDGYLSRANTVVAITLKYPELYSEDLIVCNANGLKVAGQVANIADIEGTVGIPDIIRYVMSGNISVSRLMSMNMLTGTMTVKFPLPPNLYYYSRDNVANYDTITDYPANEVDNVKTIASSATNLITAEGCFRNCKKISSLDISGLNTSKINNMEGMFY